MAVEIDNSDEISRCIIYARFFHGEAHVDELLWKFEGSGTDGKMHESAVLRRLASDSVDVHRIGCGIAAQQNVRMNEPPPGPKRRYYCGFRTASVASLPREGDGYIIDIKNEPENGEDAHVDVALTILVEGKNARAVRRTDAGMALAEQFGPPEPYLCDCDIADNEHPLKRNGMQCLVSGLKDRWPNLVLPDYTAPSEQRTTSVL